MTAKRFMIDDCGTLIDITNRDTYDYVSDVVELLNALHEENQRLKEKADYMEEVLNNKLYDVVYDGVQERWKIE